MLKRLIIALVSLFFFRLVKPSYHLVGLDGLLSAVRLMRRVGVLPMLKFSIDFLPNEFNVCKKKLACEYADTTIRRLFVRTVLRLSVGGNYVREWIKSNSIVHTKTLSFPSVYLLNHTGDNWVSIAVLAMELEKIGRRLIVPVYNMEGKPTHLLAESACLGNLHNMEFVPIHCKKTLLKTMKLVTSGDVDMAIFYDLPSHIGAVQNGAVDTVRFLQRQGYLTTGISRALVRSGASVGFVQCYYSPAESRFNVTIEECQIYHSVNDLRSIMIATLEQFIAFRPGQWQFIRYLETFYHKPLT